MQKLRIAAPEAEPLQRYTELLAQSRSNRIYAQNWYLDALLPGQWKLALLGDTMMPVFPAKKFGISYLRMPDFCQQWPLLGGDGEQRGQMLFQLQRNFVKGEIRISSPFPEHAGLDGEMRQRQTQVLPLSGTPEQLRSAYASDLKKNLRRAEGLMFEHQQPIGMDEVIAVYRSQWGEKNAHLGDQQYAALKRVFQAAQERGSLHLRSVYLDGKIMAAAAFLRDHGRLYYVLGAPTEEGKKCNALAALIDRLICDPEFSGNVLDFEGSDIPGVAFFYSRFGASAEPYFQLSWSSLPFGL